MNRDGLLRSAFTRIGWSGTRAGLRGRRRTRRGPALALQQLERRLPLAADLTRLGPATADGIAPTPAAVTIGAATYFTADDGVHGAELWRTTGTAAGTVLVRDLNPGAAGSNPRDLTAIGSTLYFLTSSVSGNAKTWTLWKSNGSGVGTTALKSIPAVNDDQAPTLTAAGSFVYFKIHSGAGTHQLWRSDGSPAGTVVLKTFLAFAAGKDTGHPEIGPLTALGSRLYFFARDTQATVNGRSGLPELWKTDGTVAGTAVISGTPAVSYQPVQLVAAGNYLYYANVAAFTGGNDVELWRSDGTGKGTFRLKDISPGDGASAPSKLTAVGSTLYFTADDGISGRELWKTNGNALDTVRVRDIAPGAAGSSPDELTAVNSALYFVASDGNAERRIWKTDAAAGAVKVAGTGPASYDASNHLVAVGGVLYFSANDGVTGWQIWRTDGAQATRVSAITGGLEVFPFAVNGQTLLFSADDALTGRELWKTNGTAPGTALVKDINTTPQFVAPAGFSANVDARTDSLWIVADGPEASLWSTIKIHPETGFRKLSGTAKAAPSDLVTLRELVPGGYSERLYDVATGGSGRELYREGYGLVKDINPGPAGSNPKSMTVVFLDPGKQLPRLYFVANDGATGEELWTSGGSAPNTRRVKDIRPGAGSSFPAFLTPVGPNLYFQAYDDGAGTELWKSDGTEAGTVRIKDIAPGPLSAKPSQFTVVGNTVFFTADDGASGVELWKTDGTAAGTVRVKDIVPGAVGSAPRNLTAVGSTLYFVANDGVSGEELWKSDGTAAGTVRVKDIRPGAQGSAPAALTAVGSRLYFSANDGSTGQEPWVSDGTAGGTKLLRDVFPGATGSAPSSFTVVSSKVFFAANDGVAGRELWETDGTLAGTRLGSDVRPGAAGSNPDKLLAVGSSLYFIATGGPITSTPSVWVRDVPPTVPQVPPPAPALAFAPGVVDPVSQPEATQAAGLVTVAGAAGNTIAVSFVGTTNGQPDANKLVNKFVTGQGLGVSIPVNLDPADLSTIGDGLVYIVGTQYDGAGKGSDPTVLTCTLDTVPPASPLLALGPGLVASVPAAKAVQPAGIVTIQGDNGLLTAVLFYGQTNNQSDPKKLVVKYVTGKGGGGPTAVTLTAADLVTTGTGPILVVAAQYDAAGNPSQPSQLWLTIV